MLDENHLCSTKDDRGFFFHIHIIVHYTVKWIRFTRPLPLNSPSLGLLLRDMATKGTEVSKDRVDCDGMTDSFFLIRRLCHCFVVLIHGHALSLAQNFHYICLGEEMTEFGLTAIP